MDICSFFPLQITSLLQAFIDVERDLTERETPMDRLICGDVGFGKTEVALRAIFCVISAGKQAMILAPTIVLAKQHFDVISERFSIYPDIMVGLLSRFQVGVHLLQLSSLRTSEIVIDKKVLYAHNKVLCLYGPFHVTVMWMSESRWLVDYCFMVQCHDLLASFAIRSVCH